MEILSLFTNEINQNGYNFNLLTKNKIGFLYIAPVNIVPEDKNIHNPSVLYFILDDPLAIRDLNFYYRDKEYLNASTKHFLKQFD